MLALSWPGCWVARWSGSLVVKWSVCQMTWLSDVKWPDCKESGCQVAFFHIWTDSQQAIRLFVHQVIWLSGGLIVFAKNVTF